MKRVIALALVGLGLSASGCSRDYGRLSIRMRSGSPAAVADSSGIRLGVGDVVVFEAHAEAAGDRDYNGLERLELYTENPSVAQLRPSIAADTWVVNGVWGGQTPVVVVVDGREYDDVMIEVTP